MVDFYAATWPVLAPALTQLPRRVWMRRLFLRRVRVVVPSLTLQKIATEVWHLPRVRYLPNGVDLSRFAVARRMAGAVPVIGTVAALRAEKNIPRLLRAFRMIADDTAAELVIVGDGPMLGELRNLAEELGLGTRVRFTGHTDRAQEFYRDFDVFALSSDTEQMPLSVLEAMASGLPVVATDVGDVRSMLAEANGACIVPQEDARLAEALRGLILDPARRQAIGAMNRLKAERDYDQAAMFAAYAALLRGDGSCIP